MLYRITSLLLCFMFLLNSSFAQQNPQLEGSWIDWMSDPSVNFYTVQQAAEQYFSQFPIDQRKGTGWKQYKRWEYYTERRINPDGSRRQPGTVLRERLEFIQNHPEYYNSRNRSSTDGSWTELGPIVQPANGTVQPNGNGRLTSIAFHPTDANTLYVGAPAGGIWRTTNNGTTWTLLDNGLVRLGVSSIVIHPTNPNILYIGTGDRDGSDAPGYGVWRSTDAGATWTPHNTGMGNRTVNEILMDPNNPDILIATTNNRIYRSSNGGANWTQTFSGHNCKDLAMHPSNSNILYASGTRLYRSTDNGQSWTQITTGLPTGGWRWCVATSADQPNHVFVLVGNGSGLVGVYRSTDAGLTFSEQTNASTPNILGYEVDGSDSRSQAWYDLVLKADPNNANVLYAGGINIWKSTDAGASWTCIAHWVGHSSRPAVHADQHAFFRNPLNGHWYFGHDGGLHYSTDDGVTFTEITSGLAIAQVYKIGTAQTVENTVINGYQDNGTGIYYDGEFITEVGGDGMECIIDPTDENYMYMSLYYGDIRRSTNNGTSFTSIARDGTNGINQSGGWVTPFKLHPSNQDIMYIGYKDVWRATNVKTGASNAINWMRISNFPSNNNCIDLAVAPSNGDVVYVAVDNNGDRLLVSTNATAATPTWTNRTATLPAPSDVWDIEVHPTDPNTIWVALQNNHVYKSTDAGLTWTDMTANLPNINVNTLVLDHSNPAAEMLYAGLDAGIYYRDASMSSWVPFDNGLPPVEVTEIEIYYNDAECKSKLMASTYGRGLWTSDLRDPGTLSPTACFDCSSTTVCINQPMNLNDQSDYNPTAWTWSITPSTYNFINGTDANSQNPEVEFTAAGTYTIELNASNAIGSDINSKANYITVIAANTAASYAEDFEGMSTCATNCSTPCPLSGNWANSTEDDTDWIVDNAGTTSTGTGPSVDFTEGNTLGHYLYAEATSCFNATAILESGCVHLDQHYALDFAYHMLGSDMGTLEVFINTGTTWTSLFSISGDQGTDWDSTSIDLAAYSNEIAQFRIVASTGANFRSDIALDGLAFVPQSTTLPTELLHLQATCNEGLIELEWAVDNNDLSETMIMQRFNSTTNHWEDLHSVPVTEQRHYAYTDDNALIQASNYYRLALQAADGSFSYSDAVEATCNYPIQQIKAFPSPFDEQVVLQFTSDKPGVETLRIYDALGRLLQERNLELNIGYNQHQISLGDLPTGIYYFVLRQRSLRLIKK